MLFLTLNLLMLSAPYSNTAASFIAEARAACVAPVGRPPRVSGIHVERATTSAGDLPALRVTDERSGGWMYVYFDRTSAAAAATRAPCLGAQLRLLQSALWNNWPRSEWSSAVFTTDASYIVPASARMARWPVRVAADGTLDPAAQRMIVITIPHEQIHRYQKRAGSRTPRWFEEGHAEWIGRKVSRAIAPDAARTLDRDRAAALRASNERLALAGWGGTAVKRDAVMRQVSPEERRKMEADPRYTPPLGQTLSFGPGDMINDDGAGPARYEASYQAFRVLVAHTSERAVAKWVDRLTTQPGQIGLATVIAQAHSLLSYDLIPLLKSFDKSPSR